MTAYDIHLRPGVLDALKAKHDIATDAELAERLNVSKPLLSQIRTGRRGVGPTFLAGALKAFGTPLSDGPESIYEITGGTDE
ncbi:helix-turn-helix domain-containing protein [Kocuria sp. CPCC 205300]|uniref:helix-turn-helix domain-containing protein n=1 Tax=Kocuria sabuli TaxID=3071448 RepID=UPI0036DB4AE0